MSDIKVKNRMIRLYTGAGALVFAVFLWWIWAGWIGSDVPVFEVDPRGGDLRTRYESPDKRSLLITRADWDSPIPIRRIGTVYRYDVDTETLHSVGKEAWITATEPVQTPDTEFAYLPGFHISSKGGVFRAGVRGQQRREVSTKGKTALIARWAPGARRAMVLTTNGRKRFKLQSWFFPMGGGYRGQHYVELFCVPEMTPVKEAIRIPFTSGVGGLNGPHWSDDGRYLVFTSGDRRRMIVIDTEANERKGESHVVEKDDS